jgi:hypothetical protein
MAGNNPKGPNLFTPCYVGPTKLDYVGQTFTSNIPNKYDFRYYDIPTDSFQSRYGILQKLFPRTHFYRPNDSNFLEHRQLYTTLPKHCFM